MEKWDGESFPKNYYGKVGKNERKLKPSFNLICKLSFGWFAEIGTPKIS